MLILSASMEAGRPRKRYRGVEEILLNIVSINAGVISRFLGCVCVCVLPPGRGFGIPWPNGNIFGGWSNF